MIYAVVFYRDRFNVLPFNEAATKVNLRVGTKQEEDATGEVSNIIHEANVDFTLHIAAVADFKIPIYTEDGADMPSDEVMLRASYDWYSWAVLDRNVGLLQASAEEQSSRQLIQPAKVIPMNAKLPASAR